MSTRRRKKYVPGFKRISPGSRGYHIIRELARALGDRTDWFTSVDLVAAPGRPDNVFVDVDSRAVLIRLDNCWTLVQGDKRIPGTSQSLDIYTPDGLRDALARLHACTTEETKPTRDE